MLIAETDVRPLCHLSRRYVEQVFASRLNTNQKLIFPVFRFDFHKECRGMKYENIGKLIEVIKNDLEELGYGDQYI